MERTFEQTISDLRMLLRDYPPSTTADMTDGAVIFRAGNEMRGVFLSAGAPDGLDQPFVVNAWFVGQIADNLRDWFADPRFTRRPALRARILDAPPAISTRAAAEVVRWALASRYRRDDRRSSGGAGRRKLPGNERGRQHSSYFDDMRRARRAGCRQADPSRCAHCADPDLRNC